jgi:peptidoglycan/xylan/chitin deacetylase (PgdA/CDA1 family)
MMSPQTSRFLTSVAGDATGPEGGRHRRPEIHRPESLADVPRSRRAADGPRTVRVALLDGDLQPAARAGAPAPVRRTARHQRTTARPGRHAATSRPPVAGSHRAPGTLPIESWLLLGKTRQQVLLASLVAIGMLFFAVPDEQRQSGVDAVNAAAERAAGANPPRVPPRTDPAISGRGAEEKTEETAPAPAASTPAPATSAPAAPGKPAERDTDGLGPGRSLRTTGSLAIALTFDDGPDPVQTPKILAMLDQHQVPATFCLVGSQVQRHPEIVRQIAAAGHTLCNHTWDHSLTIGKDDPAKIRADLARTDAAIRAAVPGVEIPFFRAPGGNFTERLVSVAAESRMASLYWEVDPQDWRHPVGETPQQHVQRIVTEVRRDIRPGAIVLSHDFNQPGTIAAYEKLLPWLKDRYTIGIPGRPVPAVTTPPPPAAGEPKPDDPAPTDNPA